ncbi:MULTISPECIES: ATP-binding protein [Priestia]|uniref:ATP-binding protein n=1 Tax=Priestia TaxID=2800373 RepID=UPI00087E390C|nr:MULTISPECIES: ATP-binding protein [Priestia]PFW79507.1 PAS domain-containing sensor histidine kinase [Priestia aryabhattai]SDE03968.1 PAS domain S-box-containing protein [Priestia aryabhattai B8W22]
MIKNREGVRKAAAVAGLLLVGVYIVFQTMAFFKGAYALSSLIKDSLLVGVTAGTFYLLHMRSVHTQVSDEQYQLATLINSMPDFICFKDGTGKWVAVNDFGRELYHLKGIDYRGKTDAELGELVPFFQAAFLHCISSDEEAWRKKEKVRTEEAFEIPNGEVKTFDVIKVPVFFDDGSRKALITIGRDITQQKLAEALLIKKEKLSVVGELAAGIAHEIRNPLTSIKGFVQLMKETDRSAVGYANIMLDELERINGIVSEMLLLSKPESEHFRVFSLTEAVKYVMSLTSHEALLKNIDFLYDEQTNNASVYGNKNHLIQVLLNVFKNAIEAMDKPGNIYITIKTAQDNHIFIEVRDEGVGISKDRLEHIGEPFFTLKEKGMGLGLTISSKIIHDHHGTLQIESEQNKGTIVKIRLPLYVEDTAVFASN